MTNWSKCWVFSPEDCGSPRRGETGRNDDDMTDAEAPEWMARLSENKLGRGRSTAPVLLVQAPYDQLMPLAQARGLRDDWCATGANVTWNRFAWGDHVAGLLLSIQPAFDFLSARFAGTPTRGNYPKA